MMEDRFVLSTTVPAIVAPSNAPAPAFTITITGPTQVVLRWSKVAGATKYSVQELINNRWVQLMAAGSATTSCTISGLTPGKSYTLDIVIYKGNAQTRMINQSVTMFPIAPNIDHPAAGAAYSVVPGILWGTNGPKFYDVAQGAVGDCWMMASFADAAGRAPQDITRMFISCGYAWEGNTLVQLYYIRFYTTAGNTAGVLVDNELPAGGGDTTTRSMASCGQLSPRKLTSRQAQLGYVNANGGDSYSAVNSGYAGWALHAITGHNATCTRIDTNMLAYDATVGDLIVINTPNNGPIDPKLALCHSYALIAYMGAGVVLPYQIYNPWGPMNTPTCWGWFACNALTLRRTMPVSGS